MSRPSWDEVFMSIAYVMAQRASCRRAKVGGVVVDEDNQVLCTAYNGSPRGMATCLEVECLMQGNHCVRAVHVETNLVIQAARTGVSLIGTRVYLTMTPCGRCVNTLIQAGVKEVIYGEEYGNGTSGSVERLREAGIKVRRLKGTKRWSDTLERMLG